MSTVTGTDFAAGLDPAPGDRRRRQIRRAIAEGMNVPILWTEVRTEWNGHEATFHVPHDVIRIGTLTDALRVSLCAQDLDHVARRFGAILPTFHLLREAYRTGLGQGFSITPATQPNPDSTMRNTERMVRHSQVVDRRVAGRCALTAPNACKHWGLDNRTIGKRVEGEHGAMNMGWWRSADLDDLYQSPGFHHGVTYDDYSQGGWFVRRDCVVDGGVVDIESVGRSRELCGLVTGTSTPLEVYEVPGSRDLDQTSEPPPASGDVDDPANWRDPLQTGMSGQDVAAWQRVLMAAGHDLSPWNADGKFGARTRRETERWQAARGLPGSGAVDAATRQNVVRGAETQP